MKIEVSCPHWSVGYFEVENIYSYNHSLSKLRHSLILIELLVIGLILDKRISASSYHH